MISLKPFVHLNGKPTEAAMKTTTFLKKYKIVILYYHFLSQIKLMSSAGDLWNVFEQLRAVILNKLNSVMNVHKERLPPNFIPIKFK